MDSVVEIPVAQYVRMSTEHQRYSTENQQEAIAAYALTNGMSIIKTYVDAGKSGLNIGGRLELQQLLADVQKTETQFKAVLVYDVSRWGRFQDPDEAAMYEQICKQRGIQVIYCAEQFTNDGSLQSTLIKNIKRSMAAEYARELSTKVFAGQRTLIQKGFRQGGAAGYGLRRQLIDEFNQPKAMLAPGERKSLQTDRVILVPGPAEEISIIHRIYNLFLKRSMPEREIASTLNREKIKSESGRPWSRGMVHQILTNEKYIGNNIYNRTSFKLKMRRQKNDPTLWIRKDGAFESIISPNIFWEVQALIKNRSKHIDELEMLEILRAILSKNGSLSGIIIDEEDEAPSSSAYISKFGSLLRAYSLIGFTPKRDYSYLEINRELRKLYPEIISNIKAEIINHGGWVRSNGTSDIVTVNNEFTLSIIIAKCKPTQAGKLRWVMRFDNSLSPDITIVIRMCICNTKIHDYYILPILDFSCKLLPIQEHNSFNLDAYRTNSLDFFYFLSGRVKLKDVA